MAPVWVATTTHGITASGWRSHRAVMAAVHPVADSLAHHPGTVPDRGGFRAHGSSSWAGRFRGYTRTTLLPWTRYSAVMGSSFSAVRPDAGWRRIEQQFELLSQGEPPDSDIEVCAPGVPSRGRQGAVRQRLQRQMLGAVPVERVGGDVEVQLALPARPVQLAIHGNGSGR